MSSKARQPSPGIPPKKRWPRCNHYIKSLPDSSLQRTQKFHSRNPSGSGPTAWLSQKETCRIWYSSKHWPVGQDLWEIVGQLAQQPHSSHRFHQPAAPVLSFNGMDAAPAPKSSRQKPKTCFWPLYIRQTKTIKRLWNPSKSSTTCSTSNPISV